MQELAGNSGVAAATSGGQHMTVDHLDAGLQHLASAVAIGEGACELRQESPGSSRLTASRLVSELARC